MRKIPIAYQLYGVRAQMARDVQDTLRQVSALGFQGVEFAGFFGRTAAEFKSMLQAEGLFPLSSHVPLKAIRADPDKVIAFHHELGCPFIAVPYLEEGDRPGQPGFAGVIASLARFGSSCRAAGIRLIYHNHEFEFRKISDVYGLDFLFAAVPEEWLQTEIDTCWVKFAGLDPAAYLRGYKGRAPLVHLKDFISERSGRVPYALIDDQTQAQPDRSGFAYRPFGHGCQDAESLLSAADEAGAQWLVLEQDEPSGASPFEDAQRSMQTLRRLGAR